MLIDISKQFIELVDINLLHLVIFLLGNLITGAILFQIANRIGLPEIISTPCVGLSSLLLNITIMKELLF